MVHLIVQPHIKGDQLNEIVISLYSKLNKRLTIYKKKYFKMNSGLVVLLCCVSAIVAYPLESDGYFHPLKEAVRLIFNQKKQNFIYMYIFCIFRTLLITMQASMERSMTKVLVKSAIHRNLTFKLLHLFHCHNCKEKVVAHVVRVSMLICKQHNKFGKATMDVIQWMWPENMVSIWEDLMATANLNMAVELVILFGFKL